MDWVTILFVILLLIIVVLLIVTLILALVQGPPKSMETILAIADVPTDRITGVTMVQLNIKYRFSSLKEANYPNQDEVITVAKSFWLSSDSLPASTPFETVNRKMVEQIDKQFKVKGVSGQAQYNISPTEVANAFYTKGFISSLAS